MLIVHLVQAKLTTCGPLINVIGGPWGSPGGQQHSAAALRCEGEPRRVELCSPDHPRAVAEGSSARGAGLESQWALLSGEVHGGAALLLRHIRLARRDAAKIRHEAGEDGAVLLRGGDQEHRELRGAGEGGEAREGGSVAAEDEPRRVPAGAVEDADSGQAVAEQHQCL